MACFEDDFEACIAHLRFPIAHRRAIRTTNLLERLFLEERRRTKIIPHAFGERAVLKLMYGGPDPRRRTLAGPAGHRLRTPPARGHPRRARRRVPGQHRPPDGCTPAQSFQHSGALTVAFLIVPLSTAIFIILKKMALHVIWRHGSCPQTGSRRNINRSRSRINVFGYLCVYSSARAERGEMAHSTLYSFNTPHASHTPIPNATVVNITITAQNNCS